MKGCTRAVAWSFGVLLASFPCPAAAAPESAERKNERILELPPAAVFGRVAPSTLVVLADGREGLSQGSGVVVAPGVVVTNYHVVQGRSKLSVRRGKEKKPAKLTALSEKHDLALLEVSGLGASPVIVRPTAELVVGERVYAVGAPYGLELTLSDGLVSALRKRDDGLVVQTSAPVSPGSSGGGLYDSSGRLVGIVTFSRDGQNLNFANPTEWIAALRGKGNTKNVGFAPPRLSIRARPDTIECKITTEAVWGMFSGGSELLSSKPAEQAFTMREFDGQTPFLSSFGKRTKLDGRYVLDDLNRKAGFVAFGSLEPGARQLFFVQDATGAFQVTVAEGFVFYNRVRVRMLTGPCAARASFVKDATGKQGGGAGVRLSRDTKALPRCVGLTLSAQLPNGELVVGKIDRVEGEAMVVITSRGPVSVPTRDVVVFSCR